jgi:hypothetical protein
MGIDENFWDELKQGNDFIADVSNCNHVTIYKVYLNGDWIADCGSPEEAETIANGNAMSGSVEIYKY